MFYKKTSIVILSIARVRFRQKKGFTESEARICRKARRCRSVLRVRAVKFFAYFRALSGWRA